MYIVFLNPQGNFDHNDSFWTEHPDFGGQLVYVKEIAIAMAKMGHKIDILTRRFSDSKLNVFEDTFDGYEGIDGLRIVRIPCGPEHFLPKEQLWPYLDEWTQNILGFFKSQKQIPDFCTGHYGDGGLAAVMLKQKLGIPYSFTGHSLGAQKLEKLGATLENIAQLDKKYHFSSRIEAERTAMRYADLIFVSTAQEQHEQYAHHFYRDVTEHRQENFVIASPGANTDVFNSEDHPEDQQYLEKFNHVITRDINASRRNLPYIVLASRLDPKKNHIALIKAYANDKSLQRRSNIAISLRGIEDAYQDYSAAKPDELTILNEIMSTIRQYQLFGKIVFLSINSQKELAAFYRYMAKRKSLFCLTAIYEPFGLAPIEAMISGLPAVVTKYGGPSDVLKDGNDRYGVLIDVFDSDDIVKGLHMAFDDYDNYRSAGIKRVLDQYTWQATAKTYLKQIQNHLSLTLDQQDIHIHSSFIKGQHHPLGLNFMIKKINEMESKYD